MLIQSRNLTINLGHKLVLEDVNMGVEKGEIVTVIGPNGSGKSTLLRALIGVIKPTSGQVIRSSKIAIGYVQQRLHIDETLSITVRRFLSLPYKPSAKALTDALLVAGVSGLDQQQVMSLSGGQFQRVLLARALLERPDLLLLGEATQSLDHSGSAEFYQQIESVRQELGCAVIMVSHELHVVMRRSDRVICLNGHICCQGKPEIVSTTPEYQSLFALDNEEEAVYLHRDHHQYNHSEEIH